jgi:hypothetical protein
MKRLIITAVLLLTTFLLTSQTTQHFNFKTVKKDTISRKVNTYVTLDKTAKRLFIQDSTLHMKTTLFITRYSLATKYQLMDCKDSASKESIYVEVYKGTKESYMKLQYANDQTYIYK